MSLVRDLKGNPWDKCHSRMSANLWLALLGVGVAGVYVLRRNLVGLAVRENHGAFVQFLELKPSPLSAAPPALLAGLTFAVKDIFDVEGFVTGFGCPAWADTHEPAIRTAHAVAELVRAGATCVGKTHMDEMAYSINGDNFHYGTPDNPAAPGRVPGGSSSGSAVAVAAGYVDFALGTDTGGSVRVPAAFCGVLGFRPSHGAVSTIGVVPMAQSFDTVGWFARDALILRTVGHVLLGSSRADARLPHRIVIAEDLFNIPSTPQVRSLAVLVRAVEKVFGTAVLAHANVGDYLAASIPALNKAGVASGAYAGLAALSAVRDALRRIQAFEFRTNHEEWLAVAKPKLGPGTSERVRAALESEADDRLFVAQRVKKDVQSAFITLLKNDVVLVLPTVPGPPPRKNTKVSELDDFRARAFTLLSLAGMSGCCQVSVPLGTIGGLPAAVSLLARPGADHLLLDTLLALYGTLHTQSRGPYPANHEFNCKQLPEHLPRDLP